MKNRIRRLVSCMVFLFILFQAFLSVTNLFRNPSQDRLRITGLYEEGPLDVIYIGGSSTFVYWQPLKAWHDCGFTSYSYATNSLEADGRLYYLKEALKSHRPEMFVIEMRDFLAIGDTVYEAGMRNGTDSMDFLSPNRWEYIYQYLKKRNVTEDTDKLSLYLDIIKYHANKSVLSSPLAWENLDNHARCPGRGWEWLDRWEFVEKPSGFQASEPAKLDERTVSVLTELLGFCKKEGIEALFVVAPFTVTQAGQEIYLAVSDMVHSYGYDFLNTNDYYEEMGLDFSEDFYNGYHVNLFGAEKYTEFLESYLTKNYDLQNHAGEQQYQEWNDAYEIFLQEETQHKQTVRGLMQSAEKEGGQGE